MVPKVESIVISVPRAGPPHEIWRSVASLVLACEDCARKSWQPTGLGTNLPLEIIVPNRSLRLGWWKRVLRLAFSYFKWLLSKSPKQNPGVLPWHPSEWCHPRYCFGDEEWNNLKKYKQLGLRTLFKHPCLKEWVCCMVSHNKFIPNAIECHNSLWRDSPARSKLATSMHISVGGLAWATEFRSHFLQNGYVGGWDERSSFRASGKACCCCREGTVGSKSVNAMDESNDYPETFTTCSQPVAGVSLVVQLLPNSSELVAAWFFRNQCTIELVSVLSWTTQRCSSVWHLLSWGAERTPGSPHSVPQFDSSHWGWNQPNPWFQPSDHH